MNELGPPRPNWRGMTSMFGRLNDFAPRVFALVLAVVGAMVVWNLGWGMLAGLVDWWQDDRHY